MSVSPFKTFSAGEVLTAADLNSSFTQITSNGEDLGWPATKAKDLDGQQMVLDSDADSTLQVSTDDRLDLGLAGVTLFRWDGTVTLPVNGLDFIASATGNAVQVTAVGTDTNISINLVPKGSGAVQAGGTAVLANPLTTRGDIIIRDASSAVRLAVGAANTVLKSDGTDPAWGTVATAMIADDAVTLAKLAAGTDGELITWDSSGDPAAVAVGTAAQVLTSNGAGAAPTFQALPSESLITAGTDLTKSPYAVNSQTTQAHGLGAVPTFIRQELVCLTAELGYSIGDRIDISAGLHSVSGAATVHSIFKDATNVTLTIGNNSAPNVARKDTKASATITVAKWKIVITPYLVS